MAGLREWLSKAPQPDTVELGGKRLTIPDGRKRWGQLTETIAATARVGEKIVCFGDGSILRATVYAGESEVGAGEENGEQTGALKPDTVSDVVLLARLMSEVQDKTVQRFAEMFQISQQSMQSIVVALSNQNALLQNVMQRQMNETARANAEVTRLSAELEVVSQGDGLDRAIAPVMTALMGAGGNGQQKKKSGGDS